MKKRGRLYRMFLKLCLKILKGIAFAWVKLPSKHWQALLKVFCARLQDFVRFYKILRGWWWILSASLWGVRAILV